MKRRTFTKPAILVALDEQLDSAGIDWLPAKQVPPFYYDGKLYLYADDAGNFHTMDFRSLTRRLIALGFYEMTEKGRINVDPYVIKTSMPSATPARFQVFRRESMNWAAAAASWSRKRFAQSSPRKVHGRR